MRKFEFQEFGQAIKSERLKAGLTRERLAEMIHISPRYLISIENNGQAPSFQIFMSLIGMFNISVDQYLFREQTPSTSTLRHNIDAALNTLTESELTIVDATIDGILRARDGRKGNRF